MALVVSKTAYSPPINEGKDFAGTVSDADGNLVAQSEFDLPAFVGLGMFTVKEVISQVGLAAMEPGDIFMINDPYVASTHCNDVHFIKPVFYGGDASLSSSRQRTGPMSGGQSQARSTPRATSHFEEGMRIPAVKIYERGEICQDILDLILANMREPWERMGDLNAQCSALRTGDARIQRMCQKHGTDVVRAVQAEMQNHSEQLIRATLRDLPDGIYEAADQNDQDFSTGLPVTFRVKLSIEGDT